MKILTTVIASILNTVLFLEALLLLASSMLRHLLGHQGRWSAQVITVFVLFSASVCCWLLIARRTPVRFTSQLKLITATGLVVVVLYFGGMGVWSFLYYAASPPKIVDFTSLFVFTLFPLVLTPIALLVLLCLPDKRRPDWSCVRCGYDLRGLEGGRCPECGMTRSLNQVPDSAHG